MPSPEKAPSALPSSSPENRGRPTLDRVLNWTQSPTVFRAAAALALFSTGATIVSGAAVRLSGSGLGCPDWPDCFHDQLVAPWAYHPMVEFGNRVFTAVISLAVVAVAILAVTRRPARRDLRWLAGGLVAGVGAQIVIGGLVVLSHLWPPLVMLHFCVSIAMLADALVLYRRSRHSESGRLMVSRTALRLVQLVVASTGAVIVAGTAATGSGPHSGNLGAKRLPVPFHSMAELHATIVLFTIGLTVGALFSLHMVHAPESVLRQGRRTLWLMAAQGVIGYVQYFTRVPAWLVEIHILGVVLVWTAVVSLLASLYHYDPEPYLARQAASARASTSRSGMPVASEA
jgi:cytochrome c oxidase assembly protein subunit 15